MMNDFEPKLQDEITAGEKWLSGFSTPSPSSDAMERTRRAVRGELSRPKLAHFATRHWAAWRGAAAAAAVMVLAVTIGWLSFETGTRPAPVASLTDPLPLWSNEIREDSTRFAGLDDNLSDLEEWSADQPWAVNGASLYDTLEGVLGDDTTKSTGDTGALMSPSAEHRQPNAVT
jgi:hypothetical protein